MRIGPGGYSLLEFTGVLAILMPIIFGAIDVNNALQAYTALQESTNVGLRCLYTIDQGCIDPSSYRAGTRQYNWFIERSIDRSLIRQFNYSGDGYWLARPRYVFDTYQVDTVASVNYSLPRVNYTVNSVSYNRTQNLRTIVRTSELPYVTGTNPRLPQFYRNMSEDRNGTRYHSGNYPSSTLPLPANRVITQSSNPISVGISLNQLPLSPATLPGTACFTLNERTNEPDFSQDCPSANSESRGSTDLVERAARLAIWVEASARGAGSGKVRMRVENVDGYMDGGERDLGGQAFAGSGNGSWIESNFYPRGLRRHFIDIARLGEQEEWSHNYIVVPFRSGGDLPRLVFERDNSTPWGPGVEFRIDAVHVFRSRFDVRDLNATCQISGCQYSQGMRECTLRTPSEVSIPSHIRIYQGAPDPHTPGIQAITPLAQNETRGAPVNLGDLFSPTQFNTEFAARFPNQQLCDYEITSHTATPDNIFQNCPDNYGALDDLQRRAICPLNHPAISHFGAVPQSISYQDATITVPRNQAERAAGGWDYVWERNDCADSFHFSPPPSLARYRNIHSPSEEDANLQRTTWLPFGLGELDPRLAKTSDPAFQCNAIRLESMRFDGHGETPLPRNLPTTSLFSGARAELVREDDNCFLNPLRSEAQQYGLPVFAFFEPHATYLNEIEGVPTSSCVVSRTESIFEGRELVAHNINEGSIPDICKSGGCSAVISNIVPGSDSSAGFNLDGALYRARQELAHAYPRTLGTGCNTAVENCPIFLIDTTDAGKVMSWTSAMKVPMNLLAGTHVTITHTGRRTQERRFAE